MVVEVDPPRLAASVLLVRDDPFRVLMLVRSTTGTFPSARVFPGGGVEADDYADDWLPHLRGTDGLEAHQRALRIAAARETFEETSLLLTASAAARSARDFRSIAVAAGGLDLGDLHPFGHFVTPEGLPRRFDTHFFLAAAPRHGDAQPDAREVVEAAWREPAHLVAEAEAGDRSIMFPTYLNLLLLAQAGSTAEAIALAQTRRIERVQATITTAPDGSQLISVPESAGYPVSRLPVPNPAATRPPVPKPRAATSS